MLISVLPLEIQLSSEEGLGFILCLSPARTVISNVRCYGTPKRLSRMDVLETLAMLGTQEAGRR